MKKCPFCNRENSEDCNYCGSCGRLMSNSVSDTQPIKIVQTNEPKNKQSTPPPFPTQNLARQSIPAIQNPSNQNTVTSQPKGTPTWVFVLAIIGILFFFIQSIISSSRDQDAAEQTSTTNMSNTRTMSYRLTPTKTIQPTNTPEPIETGKITLVYDTKLRKGPGDIYKTDRLVQHGEVLPIFGVYGESDWLLVDKDNNLWVNKSLGTVELITSKLFILPTFTPSPTPTFTITPTLKPSPTPIPPYRVEYVYTAYQDMTELQIAEYRNQLIGRTVSETITVANVDSYGRVFVNGDWYKGHIFNIFEFCAFVTGIPQSESINLDKGDSYELKAMITNFVGNYYYFNNCEYTLVMEYKK